MFKAPQRTRLQKFRMFYFFFGLFLSWSSLITKDQYHICLSATLVTKYVCVFVCEQHDTFHKQTHTHTLMHIYTHTLPHTEAQRTFLNKKTSCSICVRMLLIHIKSILVMETNLKIIYVFFKSLFQHRPNTHQNTL